MTIQEHARRLRRQLDEADEGGYGKTAWYSYLYRSDIEALVNAALSWNPNQLQLPLEQDTAVS